ncbi:MAG TPA: radical SAM protein [Polyangiaceae bacterium]|nr:radical SAM protein [Polyangiaceae bacterium]
MRSVLLVQAPMLHVDALERIPTSTHLQVLYSFLRSRGARVEVFDPLVDFGLPGNDLPGYLRRIEERIASIPFDVLGVSAWTSFQYLGSVAVGSLGRRLSPEAVLAVGGYHPSVLPEDYTKVGDSFPFDYVVRGPGELFLANLAESESPRPDRPVVVQGSPAPLDQLRTDGSYPYHQASVFLSRGCPHACSYCSNRTSDYDTMSVEHAVAECLEADRRSTDGLFRIQDAIFGLRRPWRQGFLRELARHPLRARPCLEVRADQLDPDDPELLAPLKPVVYLGVDSASPSMLRIMNKTRSPEAYLSHLVRALRACDCHGVEYVIGVLVNHPGETPAMLRESTERFWRLLWDGPSQGLLAFMPHRYAYFPGSPIEQMLPGLEAAGARIGHPGWWRVARSDHRVMSEANQGSGDLTEAHVAEAMRRLETANWMIGPRRRALVEDMAQRARGHEA